MPNYYVPPKGGIEKLIAAKTPAKNAPAVKKAAKAAVRAKAAQQAASPAVKTTRYGRYRDVAEHVTRRSRTEPNETAPLAAAHAMAQRMFEVGGIDKKTMKEFDDLCLPKVPTYSKTMIAKIRRDANVSQNLFARYLNTSPSTVQQWETGAKKPSGAAAKLLQIIQKHGIEVLG
jgi:putative transcriptional regulator